MAMDQDKMVEFLFGALARVMSRRKAVLLRQEAEERGLFDEDDEDDEGLVALAHLRSQGRVGAPYPTPTPTPAASPQNDLIAQARAELDDLRQREELARLRAEIERQRQATAEAEALADQTTREELGRLRTEVAAQRTRTEAAEAGAATEVDAIIPRDAPEVGAVESDDRLAAVTAMGEVALSSDDKTEGVESTDLAVVARDDDADVGDVADVADVADDDEAVDEADDNDDDDDDDDPVAAHPLILGQNALRRGDPRAALDLFTQVIEETRSGHKRSPRDATIATGLCQSLRAAATARLSLADFPGAIRDINEAVDVAIALHERAPNAETLTEVAASLCDKVEVLLAVGDRQGATMLAGEGVRVLKRGLRRHTSREAVALFERLRSLRAALTRQQVG